MSSKETTPPLTSGSTDSLSTSPGEGKSNSQRDDGGETETILSNPGPARPHYYLARGHGRFTPLIALDELPSNIKIGSFPVSLSFQEVVASGGRPCTPAMEVSQQKYIIIGEFNVNASHSSDAFGAGNISAASFHASNSADIPSSSAINARLARALEGVGPSANPEDLKKALLQLNAKKSLASNQRYNPTTPGVLGQKVYCTHWMRTGECDFTQQGCMFLHAMPDLDTLELLGFRSYPRWFREMPRQYQIQNATDFNEMGLDYHRQSRGISGPGSWHNQPSRYMPQRGPIAHNLQPYPQQWSNMTPRQGEAVSYGSMDAPWRNTGFGQPQISTLPFRPGPPGSMPFDQSFTPFNSSNMHTSQPSFSVPAPLRDSIWSRESSPNMGAVNRVHKPLSPQLVSMPSRFKVHCAAGSSNKSPQSPSGGVRIDGKAPGHNQKPLSAVSDTAGAHLRAGSLFKVDPVRGREVRRETLSISPEGRTIFHSNPVQEHSAGHDQAAPSSDNHLPTGSTSARPRSATVETASDNEDNAKIIDA